MSDTSKILEIWFTTQFKMLWVAGEPTIDRPAQKLGRAWKYKGARVDLPHPVKKQPGREAKFRIPSYGGVLQDIRVNHGVRLRAYEHMVFIKFLGSGAIWGYITNISWSAEPGWVEFTVRDQWHKLERHFVREGDEAIADPDPENPDDDTKGRVPVNAAGLKMLRDAANLIEDHNYPPLGIGDSSVQVGGWDEKVVIDRGTSIDSIWSQLGERTDCPQWDLIPLNDIDPSSPYYCELYIDTDIGGDSTLLFQDGFGLNNAHITWEESGPPITHVHAVSQDNKFRRSRADVDAAEIYGEWLDWPSVDFNVRDSDEADTGLGAVGEYIVTNLSHPVKNIKVKINPESVDSSGPQVRFNQELFVGVRFYVEVKRGEERLPRTYVEVIQLSLVGKEENGHVEYELDVVPVTSSGTITEEES